MPDDILLRVLSETGQARQDIAALAADFNAKLKAMEAAARRPDFDPLSQEARVLRAEVQKTADAFVTGMRQASRESAALREAVQSVNRPVEDLLDKSNRLGTSGAKGVSALSTAFGTLRNALASVGIFLGARQIVQLGEDSVQAAIKLEALRAQLNAAAGDAETGGRLFDFAREQALRLGFDLGLITESTARFTAATKNLNITEERRLEILRATLEAARVNQLSNERLNFTLLALEQIASKGTVSLEELRRQLGDNLPGAVAILAKQLDVSIEKLFEMIKNNEVLAEDALPALAKGFAETFGAQLPETLDTAQRKIGTLKTLLFELKALVGEGILKEFSADLDDAGPKLDEAKESAKDFGETVGRALRGAASEIGQLATLIRSLVEGLRDLATLDWAGEFQTQSEGLAGAFRILYDQLSDFISLINPFMGLIRDELDPTLGDLGKTLDLLTTDLDSLTKGMRESDRTAKDAADSTQELADKQKEAADKAEEAAKALKKLADAEDEAREKIFGNREELEKQTAAIVGVVREVTEGGEEINAVRLDKIRKELQDLLDQWALLGEEPPEALKILTEELGVTTSAVAKLTERIIGNRTELLANTEALVEAIGRLREAGSSLTVEQVEVIEKEIQKLLDGFARLGEQPPAALQALAAEFEVTTTAVEKAAERQVKALEKLVDSFGKLVSKLAPESKQGVTAAAEELAKLQEELDALQGEDIQDIGDPERIAEINERMGELRDQVRQVGETFEAGVVSAEKVDEAIQSLVESNLEGFRNLDAGTRAVIQNLLGNLQDIAQRGGATADIVTGTFTDVADALDLAGANTNELRDELELAGEEGLDLDRVFANLEQSISDAGKSQESLADQTEESKERFEEQAEAAEESAKRVEEAGEKAAAGWRPFNSELQTSIDLCRELQQCMSELGAG